MATFRELLRDAKQSIREVDVEGGAALLDRGHVLLDVREPDEYEQGAIPGSVHLPRGMIETSIEDRIGDRDTPIVVMCAGGARSAFAAQTLAALGYTKVVSMDGGFNGWKDAGKPWSTPRTLDSSGRNRYQRHLLLPEVGEQGQLALLDARVLILGAGGLGSPVALYLAAAGVGTIGIVDMDEVDASNLQRQIIHRLDQVGARKVDSARAAIEALNPDVTVITHDVRLDAANVMEIIDGYDVIVDGTDNFPARYLLNDASVKAGIPVVHGSIFRFEGQVSVFDPRHGPTYRDLLPEAPPPEFAPSCAEAGVLGVLPGIIGSLQALEALKLVLGIGEPMIGRLLVFDALDMAFREFKLTIDPTNEVRWENRSRVEVVDLDGLCMPALRPG